MKKLIVSLLICALVLLSGSYYDFDDSVSLPIIMYHSILNSKSGTYIVSKTQLENDLQALIKHGYNTVFPSQIIEYVYNNGTLPPKPILITFDDGYYNNMYYGLELFQKYKQKANINIIGQISTNFSQNDGSNPNFSHLTWQQITTMAESGCFEIGNHTYDMHKFSPRYGIEQRCCESDEEYREILNQDIDLFENTLLQKSNLTTNVFAYPFGKYNQLSQDILKQRGYKLILTCTEKANTIKRNDADSLMCLGRINRNGYLSTATLIDKIIKCT